MLRRSPPNSSAGSEASPPPLQKLIVKQNEGGGAGSAGREAKHGEDERYRRGFYLAHICGEGASEARA